MLLMKKWQNSMRDLSPLSPPSGYPHYQKARHRNVSRLENPLSGEQEKKCVVRVSLDSRCLHCTAHGLQHVIVPTRTAAFSVRQRKELGCHYMYDQARQLILVIEREEQAQLWKIETTARANSLLVVNLLKFRHISFFFLLHTHIYIY